MYNKKLVDNLTTGQSKLLSSKRRDSFKVFEKLTKSDFNRINLFDYQFPEYSPYNKEYLKEKKWQSQIVLKKMTDNLNNEEEILNYLEEFKGKKVKKGNQGLDEKYLSMVDVLNAFCKISMKNNYIRPNINTEGYIDIKDGRHCVVENMLKDENFIPNDTFLDKDKNRFAIITGPNMAGKSTYMRQVALISIMAHIGCFVPAEKADISILDKIFTRVGASDNLSHGQSTFMVEMSEVSYILKNATENS
ncbi:MAG: DNA mismatch repair protein MutS, partial [Halanaerobium sp. 4-GBenrich]